MRRSRAATRCLIVLALVVTVSLLVVTAGAGAAPKRGGAVKAPWTFLIYLDGDNNLDGWGQYTLDLMRQGLAASALGNVRAVVLYDHQGPGGAEKLLVTAAGITKVADVPEPDMSSPDTLADFVAWGIKTYPSDRYVLDVWDHGSGWVYLCSDVTTKAAGTSPTGGVMLVDGLGRGLAAGEAAGGDRVDLVVFEACNMGMLEVSYELRSLCDVVVGTELTQDFEGIPWERTLAALDGRPAQTTMDAGRLMVDGLVWSYAEQNRDAKCIASLSAMDSGRQAAIAGALDELAGALLRDPKHWQGAVSSAAAAAKDQIWGTAVNGINWFADLGKFSREIQKQVDDRQVDAAAAKLTAAVDAGLYTSHSKNLDGKLYGITVNFPPNRSAYDMKNWLGWDYAGLGLDLTADTRWDEFLRAYYVASGQL